MTIWEKIYQSYKKGGKEWASLKKELLPDFLKFIKSTDFKIKNAFDVGCGDGRYMKHLSDSGFKITGIDSSEIAIEMSRKNLGNEAELICAEFFEYDFLPGKYDLIYSISSIHHGFKKDIGNTIGKIYDALIPGGFAFITLPDISDIRSWNTFKKRKELAPGTFVPLLGPEAGLTHSFFNEAEIKDMFLKFSSLEMFLNKEVNWIIIAKK